MTLAVVGFPPIQFRLATDDVRGFTKMDDAHRQAPNGRRAPIDQAIMRSMICYKTEAWPQSAEKEPAAHAPPNRRKSLGVNPSAQTRTMTVIDYKGYRIEVTPVIIAARDHAAPREPSAV